jgi:hypothetical protein
MFSLTILFWKPMKMPFKYRNWYTDTVREEKVTYKRDRIRFRIHNFRKVGLVSKTFSKVGHGSETNS